MKSLLLTNDFLPIVSGISTYFYNIWRYLPKEEHLILTTKCDFEDFKKIDEDLNIKRRLLLPSSQFRKSINILQQLIYSALLITTEHVERMHCGQLLGPGTVGLILNKLFAVKYFLYVYGHETSGVYCKSTISTYLVKKILAKASKIVAVSYYVAQEFIDYGIPKDKIVVVFPGVDVRKFRRGSKPTELLNKYSLNGDMILLTASRLTERKGQDAVIRALPKILEAIPNLIYMIVGTGHYEHELKNMVKEHGIRSKVFFTGHVSNEELPKYYNLADLYVMPNRENSSSTDSVEGFGISFLEANACEKAVVGGDSGGAKDAIVNGVTGILVDPNNPGKIADTVIKLLKDQRRLRTMGIFGRERVEKEFDWKMIAEKFQRQLFPRVSD